VPVPAKILIVDDHELVRRALRSLLAEQRHWKIYEASDGQEAIEEIQRLKPDVAILDIVMPRMSGIEAAYEMRRLVPDTKIILMSSHYTAEKLPPWHGYSGTAISWRNRKWVRTWCLLSAAFFPRKPAPSKPFRPWLSGGLLN